MTSNKLGIDIGRVIISPPDPAAPADTSFLGGTVEDAMRTPPTEGAFAAIAELVERFGAEHVWLVSKCYPRTQRKTTAWLAHHRFHAVTGLPEEHVRFCLERPQKADHCEELGITHFVDDRLDVLAHLRGRVPSLFLFGPQDDRDIPDWVTPVGDWAAAREAVIATLRGASSGRLRSSGSGGT